ncbi:MAG TPA: acyl transferase [Ferruginibacter sp.]|nr:acyl transferase [Ferruginibacter sp.]
MINVQLNNIEKEIFQMDNAAFEHTALSIFNLQFQHCAIYNEFCRLLNILPQDVHSIRQIPFLPIHFFKTHQVVTGVFETNLYFESSGTTSSINSKHWIYKESVYINSFISGFEKFYGSPENYCIIGLLPNYLEKGNSSLVYMVNELIIRSKDEQSGFYLDNSLQLQKTLQSNEAKGRHSLLIGVTYALLDFAEQFFMPLKHTTIMETGGMKGRREELTRAEVHNILKQSFGLSQIHSEYGMTELLSQAYSKNNGIFYPSNTMKVLIRAEDDPFDVNNHLPEKKSFRTGAINIIDLANLYSCAFIATDDMAKLYADGSFEVLGRLDNSDIRGCSLMAL